MGFTQFEEEAIQDYIRRSGGNVNSRSLDQFVGALRSFTADGGGYYVDGGIGALQGNQGAFRAEELRAKHLLEMHNQRVTTQRTPYHNVIIKTGTDKAMDIVVGSFDSTWDKMEKERQRGVLWNVEVQVALSKAKRNRVVGVSLFSPQVKKPDPAAKLLSQHLEDMDARAEMSSKCVGKWQYLLEEASRCDDTHIPASWLDKNISVDGLIRLLRDTVCEYSCPHGNGVVSGDPMIRIQLERAYGIIIRGSHLSQPAALALTKSWLWDIVEFTETRNRYWDHAQGIFVTRSENDTAPPSTPMEVIWKQLRS